MDIKNSISKLTKVKMVFSQRLRKINHRVTQSYTLRSPRNIQLKLNIYLNHN